MKEKIYTIPVNEAFEKECECPLCYLKAKLEKDAIDYALGGAMMEPDYRIVSNDKGYCSAHYSMMLSRREKLSLALILDTHFDELINKMDEFGAGLSEIKNKKRSIFKKNKENASDLASDLRYKEKSCVVCEKLKQTMERYIGVVFYLWEKDPAFKEKITSGKGFCLPHFNELTAAAFNHLSKGAAVEFIEFIHAIEKKELTRLKDEVHKFTLKFDYRHVGEKWGSEIDAPMRAAEKLSGYIACDENKEK